MNDKLVFGFGVTNKGEYKASIKGNHTKAYIRWKHMIQRCYSNKYQSKQPIYTECSVCEEWRYFQNFAEWFYKNYYELENGENVALDKDLLVKNNKIYSPDTCIFLPMSINNVILTNKARRGNLPIGVSFKKSNNKYSAQIQSIQNGKNEKKGLGYYSDAESAFYVYKENKEKYLKEYLENNTYYKNNIPINTYNKIEYALNNYKVSIDD